MIIISRSTLAMEMAMAMARELAMHTRRISHQITRRQTIHTDYHHYLKWLIAAI